MRKCVAQLDAQYNSSELFSAIDRFQGRFMKDIYEHHVQCQVELDAVTKVVAHDIKKISEPSIKPYALQKTKYRKLREKIIERNRSKAM